MPTLQNETVVVELFKGRRGVLSASSALLDPTTRQFAKAVEGFLGEGCGD